MRTTVTLDPDTHAVIRRLMRERGLTFKEAVNTAIRAGAAPTRRPRRTPTPAYAMGLPAVPLDKALRIAANLEDEELLRKLAVRK
jgi:hypothetical protein